MKPNVQYSVHFHIHTAVDSKNPVVQQVLSGLVPGVTPSPALQAVPDILSTTRPAVQSVVSPADVTDFGQGVVTPMPQQVISPVGIVVSPTGSNGVPSVQMGGSRPRFSTTDAAGNPLSM